METGYLTRRKTGDSSAHHSLSCLPVHLQSYLESRAVWAGTLDGGQLMYGPSSGVPAPLMTPDLPREAPRRRAHGIWLGVRSQGLNPSTPPRRGLISTLQAKPGRQQAGSPGGCRQAASRFSGVTQHHLILRQLAREALKLSCILYFFPVGIYMLSSCG